MFTFHNKTLVMVMVSIISLVFLVQPSGSSASNTIKTEALEKMGVNEYHDAGILGQGMKVAVIDIQYEGLQETIDAGELPENMITRRLTTGMQWESTLTAGNESDDPGEEREKGPHGVACAEIIHDIAPEAQLYLIQLEDGSEDDDDSPMRFQKVFEYLNSEGVRIASMSLSYFGQGPGDGRGELFNVIRYAKENYGLLLIESAGNYASKKYLQDTFRDSNDNDSHEFYDFNWLLSDERMTFEVTEQATASDRSGVGIFLSWNDWGDNPSSPDSDVDLDLYVEDFWGGIKAKSDDIQNGDDTPVEFIDFRPDESGLYFLRIKTKGGTNADNVKFRLFVYTGTSWMQYYTSIANITPPSDSFDTLSVGAVNVADDSIEFYSSRGPTQDSRTKPDVASYARVSTYSYPKVENTREFWGTSAATPHVAGLAVLILQQNPSYGPDEIKNLIEQFAKDIGNPMAVGSGIAQLPPLDTQITIVSPTEAAPVPVGAPSSPIKTTIRANVTRANGDPISGFDAFAFTVSIGGSSASVATVREVDSSYLIEVIPPSQSIAGLYDLEVAVLSASTTETNAVLYADGGQYTGSDIVLTIDRSGSMSGSKIIAAKSAATLFVDQMTGGDAIGVVSFNSSASVNYPLAIIDPTSPDDVKDAAQVAIAGISSSGGTDIAEALQLSASVLDNGRPEAPPVMILLSDGLSSWSPIDAVLNDIQDRIRVFTIGLGSDVDEEIMQQIAQRTGGTYYFSPSELELAAIYSQISGQATGRQIVRSIDATLNPGTVFSETVRVDQHISELVITISWSDDSSTLQLQLETPTGQLITPETASNFPDVTYTAGNSYATYTVNQPEVGGWHFLILEEAVQSRNLNSPNQEIPFNLSIQGVSDLTVNASFRQDTYQQGEMIGLQVSLSRNVAILGAEILAEIVLPDGSVQMMPTLDNGEHGDGRPGDGVYGLVFFDTHQTGTYRFNFTVTGRSDLGEEFTRFTSTSTVVGNSSDSDFDNLPDTWETMFGTDIAANDALEDYDEDELPNIDEYNNGTDPFNWDSDGDRLSDGDEVNQYGTMPTVADTDRGGTPDGIEILKGRNPLDPSDDQVVFRNYLPILSQP